MINFVTHEVRAGQQGAREDFEQMLGLLVQATQGDAHLVFAHPGDWGIDVLVGDLNGQASIWQAKYFIREFKEAQKDQVRESFRSAMRESKSHGYAVDRWTLCVPISLDPSAMQWWQRWKAGREGEHPGLYVDLWDENRLRSLLITPGASNVRRAFYEPPARADAGEERWSRRSTVWPTAPAVSWEGGAECRIGREVYLLHEPARERTAPDRSFVWREATAERIEPAVTTGRGLVWLRQVRVNRRTGTAEEQLAGLQEQGALLIQLDGRAGLPQLACKHADRDGLTLVTIQPPGRGWREMFGPGPGPAAALTAAMMFSAAADVAAALAVLHAGGASHRTLHPGALLIDGSRCRLRDAGLAAIPPVPGEGGEPDNAVVYQAPEQRRSAGTAGPATDVYRLASIVYHTLAGHPPAPTGSPPTRAAVPGIPEDTDEVLLGGLDPDPARRPAIRQLAEALRNGSRAISLGGGT
jgi:hypothetical protein